MEVAEKEGGTDSREVSDAPESVAITTNKQSSGVKKVDRQCYRSGRGRGQ